MAEAIRESMAPPINADQVAALLPATAPAPELARRVSFWKGLLFYWLVPGRLGPHLAVGSWRAALAAHALSVAFALAVAGYLTLIGVIAAFGYGSGLRGLREGLACSVLNAAMATSATASSWTVPLLMLGIVPAAELALVVEAVFVMPWCAGGDSAWSVFKRSLRNVYWSSTIFIPTSLLCLAGYQAGSNGITPGLLSANEVLALAAVVTAVLLFVYLALRTLIVGAKRYVGEPMGPAFSPREPLCDQCGYRITGLPLTGRCPECGLAVSESLPGGRRRMTVWEQYEFRPRGFRELVRLQWRIIRRPAFFETLPVQSGHAAARHFWWGTFLLIVLGSLVLANSMQWVNWLAFSTPSLLRFDGGEGVTSLIVTFGVPFVAHTIMLFVGCLWAQFRLGIRDYRMSAAVCNYASPLIWPLTLVVLLLGFFCASGLDRLVAPVYKVNMLGIPLNAAELLILFMVLLAAGSLLYWWLRLCRALRAVRFANV